MSIAQFGLTPQPSLRSLPQMRYEEPLAGSETLANGYEALSRLSLSLASLTPAELTGNLAAVLRPLLDFDFLDLVVFKDGTGEMLWRSIGAGQTPTWDVPMEETMCWWVYQRQQPLYIADWRRDERFVVRREALKQLGVEYRSFCRLPLRTPKASLGVLTIASFRPHDYSAEEMRLLSLAADQVAMAVANSLQLERSRRTQSELDVQNARLKLLADLTNSVANLELDDLLREVTVGARRVIQSDFAMMGLMDPESGRLQIKAFDLANDMMLASGALDSLGAAIGPHVFTTGKSWSGKTEDIAAIHDDETTWSSIGFKNICVLPLKAQNQVVGIAVISKREDTAYTQDEVDFLTQVSSQVAIAVEKDIVYRELRKLKDNLGEERVYLEEEIGSELNFEEIVGRSAPLHQVLRQVEVVAPTDSGVLIQGETGTGKELIARAIHNLSSRRDRPFIKLNCAAIPSGLLESELFGHEKGAFTGAIMRKAGRFEVADKGTLFLDEVGDIPLDLQPKLLRVLQEREFERLGSTRTQQVDVRVIAATHRDLKQMCEDGEFRSDLFYRLHVFPLPVPPLRDRREDIPILVRHYVDKYARRMNRRIESIPSQAMEIFSSYAWPGNVRELQNFIERAVILSPGSVLRPPLAELRQATVQAPSSKLSSLEEVEREHVLRAIRESNWVIGGPHGAAARLGMKRTTLAYRIRKLNIPCRPL
jgi:formate hydrogenlyase transcriptional activator